MAVDPTSGSNHSHTPAPDGSSRQGNAHNVTVDECRQIANDPERSNISEEEYNQLTPDYKALYVPDENGGYKLSQEVHDVLARHGGASGNDV